MKKHIPPTCRDLTYLAMIQDQPGWDMAMLESAIKEQLSSIAKSKGKDSDYYAIAGCIAGGEAGVDLADAFSEHLGVLSNGASKWYSFTLYAFFVYSLIHIINQLLILCTEGVFANRRDKKVQQELVRDTGLRAVRQACGEKFSEVEEFLRTEEYPVVLKPTDSAGSDGVKLCESFEEAKEHFEHLLTVEAVNGGYNEKVLCQEFLKGKEVSSIWFRLFA